LPSSGSGIDVAAEAQLYRNLMWRVEWVAAIGACLWINALG
jgi:hypothetical protein